jgi:biotin-dependent carboxylase-like uncharacterized protein
LGNALLGNPADAAALEITLAGPTLEATCPVALALCGAPFDVTVDGQEWAVGVTRTLYPGQRLVIGGAQRGARMYVCVAGGLLTPPHFGSRSMWEPIRCGQVLPCRPAIVPRRKLPEDLLESLVPSVTPVPLRVLDGPQRSLFPDEAFFRHAYTVLPASNRMGLRLRGPALTQPHQGLHSAPPQEMLSEPVAPGAVQVTHDGQPLILGVDGQTVGGYPKIAHVIRADLDTLGQLRPGDVVRFVRVTLEEAEQAGQLRDRWLHQWQVRLSHAEGAPTFLTATDQPKPPTSPPL